MNGQFDENIAAPRRTLTPKPPLPPAGEGKPHCEAGGERTLFSRGRPVHPDGAGEKGRG